MDKAVEALSEKLQGWLDAFILNLPNIVLAIIVFVASYYLSSWIRKLLNKGLKDKFSQPSIRHLIANIAAIVFVILGMFLALEILNLNKALTSILAGAGVAGLAVGLALQGTLANTFSGIFLSVKDIVTVGDFIESNGYLGKVDEITLRFLRLREPDNNIVIIPNRMVVENPFKNYSLTELMRITMECGVDYGSDLEEVKVIAITAIREAFGEPENKEIEFHYLEFGGSSINFQLRFWTTATNKKDFLEKRSQAIIALKKAFDKKDINIPFPIRTLMFDNKLELENKES